MADAALDAVNGEDKFKGNKVAVRTLMVLYPNRMHVVTIEGTGIEKMSDLKGKRVSTGSPRQRHRGDGVPRDRGRRSRQGQGHEARAARRRRVRSTRIKDKKIDAFFWVGGLPTAAVTDLGATPASRSR